MKKQSFSTDLNIEKSRAITIQALEKLGWEFDPSNAQTISVLTNTSAFSFGEKVEIVFTDGSVTVSSELVEPGKLDVAGKNKANVANFQAAYMMYKEGELTLVGNAATKERKYLLEITIFVVVILILVSMFV